MYAQFTLSVTQMLQSEPTGFDFDAAFHYLKEKYGIEGESKEKEAPQPKPDTLTTAEKKIESRRSSRKRARSPPHGGGNKDTSPDFSPSKWELVAVEENRPIVEALREMGGVHYKLNEPKKGSKIYCLNSLVRV